MNKEKFLIISILPLFFVASLAYGQAPPPPQTLNLDNQSSSPIYVWVMESQNVDTWPRGGAKRTAVMLVAPHNSAGFKFQPVENANNQTVLSLAFCTSANSTCTQTSNQYSTWTIVPTQSNTLWKVAQGNQTSISFPKPIRDNTKSFSPRTWSQGLQQVPTTITFSNGVGNKK